MNEETKNKEIKKLEDKLNEYILNEFRTEITPLFESRESIEKKQPTSIIISRILNKDSVMNKSKEDFYYCGKIDLREK